jgi:hypothetical protein
MLEPWPIGQFCVPNGTFLNCDKPVEEMTEWERLVQDRVPPLNAVLALDWSCAWEMHEAYPDHRHRLRRLLGPFHEEMFQRLVDGSLRVLSRAQVSLARQLEAPLDVMVAKERAEQAQRKDEAAKFRRELEEQLNSNMKGS